MIIEAEDLQEALRRVAPAIDKKHHVEQLRNVCFRDNCICGYNQQLGISRELNTGLTCCLPFDRLLNAARTLSGAVTISENKKSVQLCCGKFKTSIAKTPTTSYPEFLPRATNLLADTNVGLIAAIGKVFPCASTVPKPPQLYGIAIYGKYVYAAEQGAKAFARAEFQGYLDGTYVLPRDAAKALLSFGEPTCICANEGVVKFDYADTKTTIVVAQWAHEFPAGMVDTVIDEPVNIMFDAEMPDGLSKAVERVCSVSEGSASITSIVFTVVGGVLTVSSYEDVVAQAEEELYIALPYNVSVRLPANQLIYATKHCARINFSNAMSDDAKSVKFVADDRVIMLALMR